MARKTSMYSMLSADSPSEARGLTKPSGDAGTVRRVAVTVAGAPATAWTGDRVNAVFQCIVVVAGAEVAAASVRSAAKLAVTV